MSKLNCLEEMRKLQNDKPSRFNLIQGRNLLIERLRQLGEEELVDEYCKLLPISYLHNDNKTIDNIKFKKEYECIWK